MTKAFLLSLLAVVLLLYLSRPSSPPPSVNLALPTPTTPPILTPTSTPPPQLTFAQLDALYGPCIHLPVLMYHHIQSAAQANSLGQNSLTVYTPVFRSQMAYLRDRGYTVIPTSLLIAYFHDHQPLPPKSILITFDDGYQDFYTDASPILQEYSYPSVLFISTGLIDTPGYLSWSQITSLAGNNQVYIGNHTWSHHSLAGSDLPIIEKEISTADTQILSHNLPLPQVIAYPFGSINPSALPFISQRHYQIGFTTRSGSTLCSQLGLQLPRLRPGNSSLSNIGL